MVKLRDFGEIVRDFSDIADFIIVYIEEAHPSDGWALKVSSSFLIQISVLSQFSRDISSNGILGVSTFQSVNEVI